MLSPATQLNFPVERGTQPSIAKHVQLESTEKEKETSDHFSLKRLDNYSTSGGERVHACTKDTFVSGLKTAKKG